MAELHPEPIVPVRIYTWVFLALLVLAALTTAFAYVDLGIFNTLIAMLIATCKMLLVALFFMHIRHSTQLTKLVVVGGLLWLGILLALTLSDFATRGWIGVPGK